MAQPYYFQPEIVDFSYPVISESYVVSHPIKNQTSSSDSSLANFLTIDYNYFLTYFCLNILVYLFIFFQTRKLIKRMFNFRRQPIRIPDYFRIAFKLILLSFDNGFQSFKYFRIPFFGFICFSIYVVTYFTGLFMSNGYV